MAIGFLSNTGTDIPTREAIGPIGSTELFLMGISYGPLRNTLMTKKTVSAPSPSPTKFSGCGHVATCTLLAILLRTSPQLVTGTVWRR